MKTTVLSLALAAGVTASPFGWLEKRSASCLSQNDASKFINRFITILEHADSDWGDYVTTAQRLLTDDFQEISDSINMLANKPLGSVTANKAAYIAGAQHAPPTTGITNLGVTVSNCNNLIWEWNMAGVGMATYPVKGIGLMKLARGGKLGLKLQLKELKLEFNNIAWGLDTGYGWVKQDGTLLGRAPNPTTPADDSTDTSTDGTSTDGTTTTDGTATDGTTTTDATATDGTTTTDATATDGTPTDGTTTADGTATGGSTTDGTDNGGSTTDGTIGGTSTEKK